ncbi:MAG: YifB family Mg chelatase-like AAA ATPase [Betaproteobacteria bacterium]|nr:YifB family Mg chelatase-like AAA ATPase [Betaproteobacteria bacterium]
MAFAVVCTRALVGVAAPLVQVEIHLANGLPQFNMVGLPDTEVRESRERVRAALVNCGFQFPPRRVTVNLAPADLPKQSSRFDLPIAIGILAASGQINDRTLHLHEFAGELALSGTLRPVRGALPMAVAAGKDGRKFVLPWDCAQQGALARSTEVYGARHLMEVCLHLSGEQSLSPVRVETETRHDQSYPDMADVRGQLRARRALEIAAAGGHHVLMKGPPGTGKSMLAGRFPGICPPLDEQEAMEVAAIQSASEENFSTTQWGCRPFRQPHHAATVAALAGGGARSAPGEASLAHGGILHLDEMTEFTRSALEALREPLETGVISVSRAARKVTYPARFQLVGTMNPCPCGFLGHPSGQCHCSPQQVARYLNRISGPLLDRIDLVLEVPAVSLWEARQSQDGEPSARVRERVVLAVQRQKERQEQTNARVPVAALLRHAVLEQCSQDLLSRAANRFSLSARAVHRILRVARTVADLRGDERVRMTDLAEAISYRGWACSDG